MRNHRTVNLLPAIFVLLVFLAPRAIPAQQEQEETSRLEGKVLDVDKKPVENAEVLIKNSGTGGTTSAKTNKKGEFSFRRLFPGKYDVTIQKEGFVPYTGQVELKESSGQRIEVTLAKAMSEEQKKANEAIVAFKKAGELFKENKVDEAILEYQKAIELKPDFVEAYMNVGILLFQKMRDEEAEKAILKALELKPEDAKAKEILGNIYFEQSKSLLQNDKIDEALGKLKLSQNYRPDYSYTNYLLGYAYNKKGMKEDAIKHFELFLQQEPNAPQAAQVKTILEQLKKK
jgi:tetratricopeptide (TPR) repeat protein